MSIALLLASTALAPLVLALAVLLVWSYPGRPVPPPGGSAEKVFVTINGVPQGLILTSRDPGRPVLLYLHGGMPDYFLARRYQARFEDDFTVCWWEQRGSGLVQVPVYFLHGRHDYTCAYAEARAYFDALHAPLKAFYSFPDAAHSPIFEDPDRAQQILRQDVLRGDTTLADERALRGVSDVCRDVVGNE